jgi:hypothetical protein
MARLTEVASRIERDVSHKLARGTLVLPLPVYEGSYAAQFGVADAARMDEFAETMGRDVPADETVAEAAQFIADTCRRILARDGKGWEALEHEDARPVRFDEDFAKTLGLRLPGDVEPASSSDVVLACWVTDEGDIANAAIASLSIRLLNWMKDTRAPVEGEIVQGLPGGRK